MMTGQNITARLRKAGTTLGHRPAERSAPKSKEAFSHWPPPCKTALRGRLHRQVGPIERMWIVSSRLISASELPARCATSQGQCARKMKDDPVRDLGRGARSCPTLRQSFLDRLYQRALRERLAQERNAPRLACLLFYDVIFKGGHKYDRER